MKRIVPLLLCTIAASVSAQSFQFHGFVTLREIYVKAQPSWTQGGFGKFDVGAASSDDHRYVNTESAQLGADWTPASWLLLHADGVARREQSGTIGKRLTVYNEEIAAVPDRTRPIGPEIDHRIGDSERLRVQLPERAMIQFARVDNRTQLLIRNAPNTPWRTKFNIVSADVGTS